MKVSQRLFNLMNPCPQNSEFKRLHNDVKEKLLVFQGHKKFPGMWTAGVGGEQRVRKHHHGSFLSCEGWAQVGNRHPSYTGSLTAGPGTSLQ